MNKRVESEFFSTSRIFLFTLLRIKFKFTKRWIIDCQLGIFWTYFKPAVLVLRGLDITERKQIHTTWMCQIKTTQWQIAKSKKVFLVTMKGFIQWELPAKWWRNAFKNKNVRKPDQHLTLEYKKPKSQCHKFIHLKWHLAKKFQYFSRLKKPNLESKLKKKF